jgi:hypothetical protein
MPNGVPDGSVQEPIYADNELSAEILCVPTEEPTDPAFKKHDGWPLKKGWYYHDTPILDDLVVKVLNGTEPYSAWNKSEAEFYRRSIPRWSYYFPAKVKRRHATQLLYNSESYTVRRKVAYANEFSSYMEPFVGFVEPVSNDQYVKRFSGLMDDPSNPCETTHTFHPAITANAQSELSDKSDKIPLQQRWARLVPYTLTGNNSGIDIDARIADLFPYPPEDPPPPPADVERVTKLREYARHVCARLELDVDTRLFDDMAYKGSEVLDWRYQPNISYRTNDDACMTKSESRTPFNSFGDLVFLGGLVDEEKLADIWIQSRITFPTQVSQNRTLIDLGFPSFMTGQYNPTNGTIEQDPYKRVAGTFEFIAVSQNSNIPGPFSYLPNFDGRKYNGDNGYFTPSSEIESTFISGLNSANYPCAGLSLEQAIREVPKYIFLSSRFQRMNGTTPQAIIWSAKYKCLYNANGFPTEYVFEEPPVVTLNDAETIEALGEFRQWLDNFYLSADRYKQVGKWILLDHPQTGFYGPQQRNVCCEVPIYAHSELLDQFDIEIEMNPWGWAKTH